MSLAKLFRTLTVIFIILTSTTAFAHRVNLFAYVEGNTVFTESYFSKSRKVHQGKLEVFSTKSGDLLLKAKTNDEGNFNFPIPEATKKERSGLLIYLYASEGHRAEWTINADEIFPDSTEATSEEIQPAPEVQAQPYDTETKVYSTDIAKLNEQLSTLTDKVETLKRLIISQQEKGPGVNEIFSGLGYILGLFGVAAFFLSRKK
ncbi:hypothetical protein [Maridesulfovibrio sp.]|uniref:hypothetical protein n=1 Tax=Maridesulfovibrio sp. TaxID=2795000 RepID=UPI0029CA1606|nr:hypothetical protein [Maridesulfovibrio sp.]